MRVPSGDAPAQPLTYMWERHKEIARRLVAGDRQKDIADDLQITYSRMSIICNSPAFKSQVDRLSVGADNNALGVADRITQLSDDAMATLEDVLQQGEEKNIPIKTRVSVAQDVLDRAGHSAVKKVHSMTEKVLTAGDIAEMRKRKEKDITPNHVELTG